MRAASPPARHRSAARAPHGGRHAHLVRVGEVQARQEVLDRGRAPAQVVPAVSRPGRTVGGQGVVALSSAASCGARRRPARLACVAREGEIALGRLLRRPLNSTGCGAGAQPPRAPRAHHVAHAALARLGGCGHAVAEARQPVGQVSRVAGDSSSAPMPLSITFMLLPLAADEVVEIAPGRPPAPRGARRPRQQSQDVGIRTVWCSVRNSPATRRGSARSRARSRVEVVGGEGHRVRAHGVAAAGHSATIAMSHPPLRKLRAAHAHELPPDRAPTTSRSRSLNSSAERCSGSKRRSLSSSLNRVSTGHVPRRQLLDPAECGAGIGTTGSQVVGERGVVELASRSEAQRADLRRTRHTAARGVERLDAEPVAGEEHAPLVSSQIAKRRCR